MKVQHDGMLCADTEVFSPNHGVLKNGGAAIVILRCRTGAAGKLR